MYTYIYIYIQICVARWRGEEIHTRRHRTPCGSPRTWAAPPSAWCRCGPEGGGPTLYYCCLVICCLFVCLLLLLICSTHSVACIGCGAARCGEGRGRRLVAAALQGRPQLRDVGRLCSAGLSFSRVACTLLYVRVSSLRRGHANLLCIVPIIMDAPRRESTFLQGCRSQTGSDLPFVRPTPACMGWL